MTSFFTHSLKYWILASLCFCARIAAAQDGQPSKLPQENIPKITANSNEANLPEPMNFTKERYAEALRLNALPAGDEKNRQIKSFVGALVDYNDAAKRSLGDQWDTIPAEKQTRFQALFRELAELSYVKKLSDKSFKDNYNIDWDRVVKTKTSATVSCFTKQKDVETELEIILHAVNGQWQIYDTLVDGASLAQTYQKKYAKKLEQKGIDEIILEMKKEIDRLKKS